LQALLGAHGIDYRINSCLVRGLDYYNLTVFEWVTDRLGAQGTVCAGGRYDGLFEQLGGKPQAACGWAMGMERLLALLAEGGSLAAARACDVYLVNQGESAAALAFRVAEQLRDAGCTVIQHCGGGSFKSQMKKADASGARLAVIIGDDEAAAGEVTLKPLRDARPQSRVKLAALAQAVTENRTLEKSETA
jgi:histidyl-tRNA synthetase